jgi:hypothetical protein
MGVGQTLSRSTLCCVLHHTSHKIAAPGDTSRQGCGGCILPVHLHRGFDVQIRFAITEREMP